MNERHWQLEIFKKSIKKKDKLKLIENNIDIEPSFVILDLGCAQGILSYFLRQKGGFWVSADLDFVNLKTSQELLQENLIQIGTGIFPFESESFDMVVSLDYLEHIEDDDKCLEEVYRVLKKRGKFIIVTPHTGKFLLLHKLRSLMGLKPEVYGHKREGYSLKGLKSKLEKAQFIVERHKTFTRFFSEFIELIINFLYIKLYSGKFTGSLRDGHIRPTTSGEFSSRRKTFKIYSFIYPLVWFLSRLDKLLFFHKGYCLTVWAKKPG